MTEVQQRLARIRDLTEQAANRVGDAMSTLPYGSKAIPMLHGSLSQLSSIRDVTILIERQLARMNEAPAMGREKEMNS